MIHRRIKQERQEEFLLPLAATVRLARTRGQGIAFAGAGNGPTIMNFWMRLHRHSTRRSCRPG
jgi:hypothetical protein